MRMTLGLKIGGAFITVLALVFMLGFSSLYTTRQLGHQLEFSLATTAKALDMAGAIRSGVYEMAGAMRGEQLSVVNLDEATAASNHSRFTAAASRIEEQIRQMRQMSLSSEDAALLDVIATNLRDLMPLAAEYMAQARQKELLKAHEIMRGSVYPILARFDDASERLLAERRNQMALARKEAAAAESRSWIITLTLIALCVAAGLGLGIVLRGLTLELRVLAVAVGDGAGQVASASVQVASASQALAQGAAEQAGSIEETSSTAHEINSAVLRTAENSGEAARAMEHAARTVADANRTLDETLTSIRGMAGASDKIAKILKVIDEIAFQTNILALNAAVEAARAGESGLGFAVVADEVRNLAQRCAQAAKDTTALIDDSISRSREGAGKLDAMATAMRSITERANSVKVLIDEVKTGAEEQARGVDQIARAMAQMDQLTQRNVSSAEESASASEELSGQAESLTKVVHRLQEIVGR